MAMIVLKRLLFVAVLMLLSLRADAQEVRNVNTIVLAADNSLPTDKSRADMVCTGIHDELVVQKAVNRLADDRQLIKKGGTIILLPGDYYIDGFQKSNRNGKVAILMPSIKSGPEVFSITVRGSNYNTECTVIHLSSRAYEALDNRSNYSLFACADLVDYCHFAFEDMKVTIPDGKKNIVCFDGRQMGSMECRRLKCIVEACSTWTTPTGKINLPVEGCIALCGCYFNCNSWNYVWEAVYAMGFGQGFACGGEHLLCIKCVAAYGKYGFTFNNYYDQRDQERSSRHTNTLIDCTDEANANFWKFSPNKGQQTINILNLNIEYWPQWFAVPGEGHFATETVPGQYNGQVNYSINRGGLTPLNVSDRFWADDSGKNFKSRNNTHKQVCTSEERKSYAPNYGQTLYDITLNKQLICVDPSAKVWVDAMGNKY